MGNAFANVTRQSYDLGGGLRGGIEPSVSFDFQLPAGNFVTARMPMNLIFPRNSESASTSYGKNAYPGIEWSIRIDVQGGAWPFKYEIISNGGATGLTIGETLIPSIDSGTGQTVFTTTPDYGRLTLPSPVAGSYAISVRVTDQDGSVLTVPISLTVGTAGWIFVDPINGDNSGVGTIDDPFATLEVITDNGSTDTTYSGYRVILRSGTSLLYGHNDVDNHYRMVGSNSPVTIVGYPGEDAVLECFEGYIVNFGAFDFYLGNLTLQYGSNYSPGAGVAPIYMIVNYSESERFTIHGVTFNDYKGNAANVGNGNSSAIWFNNSQRDYISITGNTITGVSGVFIDTFEMTNFILEYNVWVDTEIATKDTSAHAIIYIKDNPTTCTIRNNEIYDGLTWAVTAGGIGIGGANGQGAVDLEICWNTVASPDVSGRTGAFYIFTNESGGPVSGIYIYRNSIHRHFSWEGAYMTNFPDGEEQHIDNILNLGSMPVNARITNSGNIDGAAHLNTATMKLTGASRTSYLGTKGAEVARP